MIWVDILAGRLHRFRVADGGAARDDEVIVDLGVPIGSAAPRQRRRLRAGHRRRVPADRRRTATPVGGPIRPADMTDDQQFNDGACDPACRFWAGTTSAGLRPGGGGAVPAGRRRPDHPHAHRRDGVERHRLEPGRLDHVLHRLGRAAPAGQGVRLRRAHRDDRRRARTHLLSSRGRTTPTAWSWMPTATCGSPSGAAGRSAATTRRATLTEVVELPVSRPTCAGFGGPDLDELYVTSAWEELRRRAAGGRAAGRSRAADHDGGARAAGHRVLRVERLGQWRGLSWTASASSSRTAPRRCGRCSSTWATASCWCWSGRRAAARRRRCGWWRAWRT